MLNAALELLHEASWGLYYVVFELKSLFSLDIFATRVVLQIGSLISLVSDLFWVIKY